MYFHTGKLQQAMVALASVLRNWIAHRAQYGDLSCRLQLVKSGELAPGWEALRLVSCEEGLGSLRVHAKKYFQGLETEPIFYTRNKVCPALTSIHGYDLTDDACSVSDLAIGLAEQVLV